MRIRVWCISLVLTVLGVACGDQPTEVVPEREEVDGGMTQAPGVVAAATSTSDDGRSITTDKDDYAPGDTVWFTGAGWEGNDTLDILLTDDPTNHRHEWAIEVGEDGTFRDSTYVVDNEDLGVTFTLTATSRGNPEQTLTVTFTDGAVQVRTNGPTGVSISWAKFNGNVNCTGAPNTTGSISIGTSFTTTVGVDAGQSIRLTASASASGQAFSHWTLPDGSTTSTSNPLCRAGVAGVQQLTVHYAAANTDPGMPASLAQFKANGSTTIPTGGATNETSVVLKASVSDPDVGNTIKLQVEVRPVTTAFSNTSTSESGLVSSGSTASVTVSGLANNASYHWQARAMDNSGAVSAWVSFGGNAENVADFSVDTDAPGVTINQASTQADATNASPINFTVVFSKPVTGFTATDVAITGTATTSTPIVTGTGPTYNVAVPVSTDGTVIATIIAGAATDAAGNPSMASTSADNEVTYDETRPTVTINQAATQVDPTNASPVNFTVVFSEPVVGFTASAVSITGTATTSAPIVTGTGPTYNVAVPVTDHGTVIASIGADKATDAAGNGNTASSSTDHTVTYDPAPPVVSNVAVDPDPTNGTIDVTASATVDDAATGNSKIVSAYYRIDNGPDVAMAATDGGFDEATENVTASIPAATVAALPNGPHTVCVRGKDQAGNSSSYDDAGACVTLTVDKEPPLVSNVTVTPGVTNGTIAVYATARVDDATTGNSRIVAAWYSINGGSAVQMVASDGSFSEATEDVKATIPVSVVSSLTEGAHTVCVQGKDLAGNLSSFSASSACATLEIDKTPPTIACGTADGAWHAGNVSIACTASDPASGLANSADASFSLSTTVGDGMETSTAQTGSRTVFDNAGNSATAGPIGNNKVDRKAPVLTLTCPTNPVILNSPTAAAHWTATDGGSGVTPAGDVPLITSSIGSHEANVTVQDGVGNSSTDSCDYMVAYTFAGFFAPVDRPNTMNVSKAGQAIPLKWRLTDALNRPITDLTSVTVKTVAMNCDGSGAVDPIEEYATASTSGLLNLGDGNYQYNWKAATNLAGTCKSISLVFGSGAISYVEGPRAFFSFKK